MKTKLYNLWESVQASLWFIPSLMVFSAICLSFLLLYIDNIFTLPSGTLGRYLYNAGPEGARSLLSTIAGSVITVAGVVFSITVVALTLASSQFGPRLLRNFMKDKANQLVIGTFISTFIFCLLILRSIEMYHQQDFVPSLSVTVAVMLMIINAGVLVFFIHHISSSIQADNVITEVHRELHADIERIFVDDGDEPQKESFSKSEIDRMGHEWYLKNRKDGYIQSIDSTRLVEIATKHDLLIQLPFRAGHYAVKGKTIAIVKSREKIDEDIAGSLFACLLVGTLRTPEQDPEYALHQLVEIALRALSPSINDPFTAIACVDRLGSAIALLTSKTFPSRYVFDGDRKLRLIREAVTFSGMVNGAFDQIRQYGSTSVAVIIRQLEVIDDIASLAGREHREALHRQARMIHRTGRESIPEKHDREDIDARYEKILESLNMTSFGEQDNG